MADLPEGYRVRQPDVPEGYAVAKPPPTLEQRAQDVFGLDPNIQRRGTILPIGENRQGQPELAIPQIGVDLMQSFLLPGHVLKGGTYTPEDALKFTLDYGLPATSHRYPTGARSKPGSRAEMVEKAPSTEELLTKGSAKYQAAKGTGAKLDADQYVDLLSKLESKMIQEGVDPVAPELHPKLNSALKSLTKRIGKDVDLGELQTIRRQLNIAANTTAKEFADERRIASDLINMLDDTVDDMSHLPAEARALWRAGRKSQEIETIVENAMMQASGFENGLRIGFRQLLKSPKRLRGFTDTEIAVMKEIEKGTPTQKALRWLSKLGPNRSGSSGFLGTAVGSYGGATTMGAPGAVAVPAAGYLAGSAAEQSAANTARYLRALAAMGGQAPGRGASRMPDALTATAGPLTGTQLPLMTQPKDDQERLKRLLMKPRS